MQKNSKTFRGFRKVLLPAKRISVGRNAKDLVLLLVLFVLRALRVLVLRAARLLIRGRLVLLFVVLAHNESPLFVGSFDDSLRLFS